MERISLPINKTYEWFRLARLTSVRPNLRQEFLKNINRNFQFSIRTPYMFYDFSRQLVNREILDGLIDLARVAGLREKIDSMFSGDKINTTEKRQVLHVALRDISEEQALKGESAADIIGAVARVLMDIKKFSEQVHSGEWKGVTGKKIKNIVSIGIGGSYLGPEFLAEACKPYAIEGMKLVFVSNVDGTDFYLKTKDLNPEETLFVVVSKTFTTAETMKNAETAKRWMIEKLKNKLKDNEDISEIVKRHFVAVSTAEDKVLAFGIERKNMFGFWDFVGGRYSATSAVGGVSLSLYLGFENFKEILKGAHWMDLHFRDTPFPSNIPVMSALIDILNINFYGFKSRALLPYSQLLHKLPAHTQQVEMESNGKSVDIYGYPVDFDTGEVVFGESGTNGQHSFYQLIHQGTQIIPCDFIGFIHPNYAVGELTKKEVPHHLELMTNFLAQPDALAFGKTEKEVRQELYEQNEKLKKQGKEPLTNEEIEEIIPHKVFSGNRPSSSILMEKLTPFTAGILLAWTEHRAATKGFIWGINSFDQFGVELGKELGVKIRNAMLGDETIKEKLNSSTREMYNSLMSGKLPE